MSKLARWGRLHGSDIAILGAPKTIDKDLCGMAHSPGFGSAARYIATTFSELWRDCRVYYVPAVTLVEVMGRNVGWLTAAAIAFFFIPNLGPASFAAYIVPGGEGWRTAFISGALPALYNFHHRRKLPESPP